MKTANENYYEEIIDKMMIEEVSGLDSDIKETLENLSTDKKRMAILSILDKDRDMFLKIKRLVDDNSVTKADHIKNVVAMMRDYVKVGEIEVKDFGEVMTPSSLVNDMLNTLPEEVWTNPKLKWLDPCSGVGVFPAVIIERLMDGLSDWESDSEKRYKHIVENMIYMGELQPKNQFLALCAFDPKDEYGLNVYTGSFLEEDFDNHMKNVWNVDKFDIILGNPPYNASQNASGKRGGGKTLWDKFVLKSFEILKVNMFLVFVHPTLWRKPQSKRSSSKKVSDVMMNKQINYLEMHDSKDGMKVFNAGTRYDFYIIENCPTYKKTIINGEDRKKVEVDLRNYNFIPNYNLSLFDKLIPKEDKIEKCPIIFNVSNYETRKEWVSNEKNNIFKHMLIHSTPKSGIRYKYSSRNDKGHFGISKVIFGESGINDVIIDMNGDYGMTQGSMAIEVSNIEEARKIKSILLSDKFTDFLKTVSWSNFRIDWRLFTYIKRDFWKEFI